MIRRAHHLHDDRLFDCYLAERRGDAIDPRIAEHLADCPECEARFSALADAMDEVRTEGEAEADGIFTPERLRAQQLQIAHRIEHVGRPARVISFPGQFTNRSMSGTPTRSASRWVAAAAAAGLFIGIALGASYEWESRAHPAQATIARDATTSRPVRLAPPVRVSTADIEADEAFLTDLETALERPRTRELVAYDAFTPHVREITDRR